MSESSLQLTKDAQLSQNGVGFNLKLTQGGAVLLAKALAGQRLEFKYVTLGSGVGSGNPEEATSFVNKVADLFITKYTRLDTSVIIEAVLEYNSVPQGFTWTELGVIAVDPDTQAEVLYMYDAIDIGEVIPPAGAATQIEKHLRISTYVSNAANVTAEINESLINIPKSDIGQPNGVAPLNEDGVLDIQYGGTGAKTKKQACDNLDAMSAVCAYYSGEDSDGILDTSTESTIIIPITRDINAELYNLIGGNWGYVYQTFFDEKTTATRRVQLVISTGTGKIACRQYDITLQKWQDWTVQATTTPPVRHTLTASDGFTSTPDRDFYYKTEDGVVTVYFNMAHDDTFTATDMTQVASLPVGFRPKVIIYPPTILGLANDNSKLVPMIGQCSTGGQISVRSFTSDTLKSVTGLFLFIAED